ncbi:Polynucleotidyl transferase ribonuclease H-like superfamily protein [Euphorbia peplus]|nr:Polynucleotidyl transferase ribonuclease H-like superfamily protein [Euphorbia peplus]
MKIISWNCFGAGGTEFFRATRHLLSVHDPDIFVLLEPRLPGRRAVDLCRRLNFSSVQIVEAEGFSGGVWVFWHDSRLKLQVYFKNNQFLHSNVVCLGGALHGKSFDVSFIYVRPQMSFKRTFMVDMHALKDSTVHPWVLIGDFNCIKTLSEKQGGSMQILTRCSFFADWIDDMALVDLGFQGPDFTWYRGSTPRTRVACRLDRALCNLSWRVAYAEAVVRHLPRNKSDHSPVLLDLVGRDSPPLPRPFRFRAEWLTHGDFRNFFDKYWARNTPITTGLADLTPELVKWDAEVFGNLGQRKRKVYRRLEGVQRGLAIRVDGGLLKLEKKLIAELDVILQQEEIMWFQKSRVNWLCFGDRNTKFFHLSTLIRRRRNKIIGLRDANGVWIWNHKLVEGMVFDFFKNLYTEEDTNRGELFTLTTFPTLSISAVDAIERDFDTTDVHRSLFSMAPFKAPGPDGFQALFFQRLWSKLGSQLSASVLHMLRTSSFAPGVNDTLITVIPKVPNPELITQFRPISLCNVHYKIVTKCIVNRLKGFLGDVISPAQSSFVPGRHITDDIILVQEVVNSMRHRTSRPGDMILKLDLEKAYDRISWQFLRDTLVLLGLSSHWVNLIMNCVASSDMSVLWNGCKLKGFTPTRGLRQGDPLSPYLFVLCIERLGHMIEDAVLCANWKPIEVSRGGMSISHVFFADDIILMAEASIPQAVVINNIMQHFCDVSGQRMNASKSKVYFSPHISDVSSRGICDILGIERTMDLGMYLGMPIIHERVKCETFSYVVDKVSMRMSGWKAKCLSFAGRLTLIKSVTSAIPSYSMQTNLFPVSVCDKLDACNRNFLWGSGPGARKIHLVNWTTVCRPKSAGGLGVRCARAVNLAFLAKLSWKILNKDESLWVKAVSLKYCRNREGLQMFRIKPNQSSVWRGIVAGSAILKLGVGRICRDGATTNFWSDKWCGFRPLNQVCFSPIPSNWVHLRVCDFWIEGRGWNWEGLNSLLPTAVLFEMASLVLFPSSGEGDVWHWPAAKSGSYTVASGYKVCRGEVLDMTSRLPWKQIWKVPIPERIRCFLWLIQHNAILCNVNRGRRHLTDSVACNVCGLDESVLHVLRDCAKAKQIWDAFIPPVMSSFFYSCSLDAWLDENLKVTYSVFNIEWGIIYGFIVWWLWKFRNERIFEGKADVVLTVEFIVAKAKECKVAYTTASRVTAPIREERMVKWIPPDDGWIKINTDGASKGNPGLASAGGVLRGASGAWFGGFAVNLGICTAFLAELWGLFFGLKLAWSKGYVKVIVEMDSKAVISLVQGHVNVHHPYGWIVRECQEFLKRSWDIRFLHVYREGNRAADWMANFAGSLALGHHECVVPPAGLQEFLDDDRSGRS